MTPEFNPESVRYQKVPYQILERPSIRPLSRRDARLAGGADAGPSS